MMNSDKEEKIIQLILGELTDDEAASIQRDIANDAALQQEFDRYRAIFSEYEQLPLIENDARAQDRFDGWLQEWTDGEGKKDARLVGFGYWKYVVAASVLVLVGWFFFTQPSVLQPVSVQDGQENMLQLIADQSTTKRIKGVRQSTAEKKPDVKVVEALLKLLENDESANVRLAVVEALQQYELTEQIKDGLIAALDVEKQPIVQIAIINALVELGEERIKPSLESLIENDEVQPFVQDEARLGLTRL